MSNDILKGNWKQMKGSIKEKWGELTDDEIAEAEGNTEKLIGKVQAKYGYERAKAENEVNEWMDSQKK